MRQKNRYRWSWLCACLLGACLPGWALPQAAFAAGTETDTATLEGKIVDWDTPFRPSMSFGFSYPLVVSASVGAMLTLGKQDKEDPLPSSPALRLDGELDLGGGGVAGGLFVPFTAGGYGYSFSVKAERMRTWLLTWDEPRGRTFNGGVVEFALPSVHGGPKVGLGSFREVSAVGGVRNSFTYVFVGLGW